MNNTLKHSAQPLTGVTDDQIDDLNQKLKAWEDSGFKNEHYNAVQCNGVIAIIQALDADFSMTDYMSDNETYSLAEKLRGASPIAVLKIFCHRMLSRRYSL